MRWFALTAMLILLAATARADCLPKTLDKVDWKAPCYIWPAVDYDGDGVADRIDHCPGTPKGALVDAWGCPTDSDGDGVFDGLDKCPDTPNGVKVDANGCSDAQLAALGGGTAPPPAAAESPRAMQAPAPSPTPAAAPPATEAERQLVEGGELRLENVYFETNSANLRSGSEAALDEAGAALEKYPDLKIEVQGHTDSRGSSEYNKKLSQARAEAVLLYLLDHHHLRAANLTARGYGETKPIVAEHTDADRQRNRRVVLKVLNPEALPHGVKVER